MDFSENFNFNNYKLETGSGFKSSKTRISRITIAQVPSLCHNINANLSSEISNRSAANKIKQHKLRNTEPTKFIIGSVNTQWNNLIQQTICLSSTFTPLY